MRDYAEHWSTSALCAQIDADIWFPVKGGIGSTRAKRICMACPVRMECLASVGPEDSGIWGGLSDRQRRVPGRMRGRTRKAS